MRMASRAREDFPQPDSPTKSQNFARRDLDTDAVHRVHHAARSAIMLDHIGHAEEGAHATAHGRSVILRQAAASTSGKDSSLHVEFAARISVA